MAYLWSDDVPLSYCGSSSSSSSLFAWQQQISYRYEYNPKLTPCRQGPHRSSQLI